MSSKLKQQQLFKNLPWKFRFTHGGELRKKRSGRLSRPLSRKDSHHIVLKVNKLALSNRSFRHPRNFSLIRHLISLYSKRFLVQIERISYQHDHIHLLARSSERSNFHSFFRVICGQIAQRLKVTDTLVGKLWLQRPFTQIVKTWAHRKITLDYIELNELEVIGAIPYQITRLRQGNRESG